MRTPTQVAAVAPYPVTPGELATGILFGAEDGTSPPRQPQRARSSPRDVLEAHCLQALQDGPVFVSFSGGRDSSAVLAAAVHVARREGLPDPVALTLDVVGSAAADERDWQELVLRHLRVEQERVPVHDELGLLGPVATSVLSRVGLLHPPNAYLHVPLLERALGGVLLTGAGGDEVFRASAGGRAALVLTGLRRPTVRDVAVIGLGLFAPGLERRISATRGELPISWVRRGARNDLKRAWYADVTPEYAGYRAGVLTLVTGRHVAALRVASHQLATMTGTLLRHPFVEPDFLHASSRAGGRAGWTSRDAAMAQLVGDLLPEALVTRPTKAVMTDAVYPAATRELVRSPELLTAVADDPALGPLVDLDELARTWHDDPPHFHSALLAQAAWLSVQPQR